MLFIVCFNFIFLIYCYNKLIIINLFIIVIFEIKISGIAMSDIMHISFYCILFFSVASVSSTLILYCFDLLTKKKELQFSNYFIHFLLSGILGVVTFCLLLGLTDGDVLF